MPARDAFRTPSPLPVGFRLVTSGALIILIAGTEIMLDQIGPKIDVEADTPGSTAPRRRKIHCKKCCRVELHYLQAKQFKAYPLIVLFTLGAVFITGPFRCTCCGTPRLFRYDWFVRKQPVRSKASWSPLKAWWDYRDSWRVARRRSRLKRFVARLLRKKNPRKQKFRKRKWF